MYVCICNAINERRILQAIEEGVTSWKELSHSLPVANQCGKCALEAKDFFEKALARKSA